MINAVRRQPRVLYSTIQIFPNRQLTDSFPTLHDTGLKVVSNPPLFESIHCTINGAAILFWLNLLGAQTVICFRSDFHSISPFQKTIKDASHIFKVYLSLMFFIFTILLQICIYGHLDVQPAKIVRYYEYLFTCSVELFCFHFRFFSALTG